MILFCLEKSMAKKYTLKFLQNGEGPDFGYSYNLPRYNKPGKWNRLTNTYNIVLCENGFHSALKDDFGVWYRCYKSDTTKCYIAEIKGNIDCSEDIDKVASERIRLIEEIPLPDKKVK